MYAVARLEPSAPFVDERDRRAADSSCNSGDVDLVALGGRIKEIIGVQRSWALFFTRLHRGIQTRLKGNSGWSELS